jgi:hypothetical protein
MTYTREIFEVPLETGGAFECVMVRLPEGGLARRYWPGENGHNDKTY